MMNFLMYASLFLIWFMLFYHMFLMIGGYLTHRKHLKIVNNLDEGLVELPTVSILIPAHNEEIVIEETIKAMVAQNYPKDKLEVIVVNDNSTDRTGKICDHYAQKYDFVKVLHTTPPQGGKGKSGALNQGLKHSTGELIVVYDADNTPEPEAVYQLALGISTDEKAGAVVGKFRVTNGNDNLLTRFINMETITFQWMAQAGRWNWFKLTTIPGTNFGIRRSVVEELGGWDEQALSEDTELSFRVYDLGYHIRFYPSAITWEQEPDSVKVWWKQRTRWARGNEYVIAKFLLNAKEISNKKVFLDLFYFLFVYILFFAGIIGSHAIFISQLFTNSPLTIGPVSNVLLVVGVFMFLTEIWLSLSLEKGQLTIKNALVSILMYFIYSQMWVLLVAYATLLELKRIVFKEEIKWYKTERIKKQKTS